MLWGIFPLSEANMPTPASVAARVPSEPSGVLPLFQRLLTTDLVTDLVAATGQRFYQRLFTPLIILWGFIYQRLNADHTCDAAVSYFASGAADGLCPHLSERLSDNTAGYCKARARLPLGIIQGALRHAAQVIQAEAGAAGLWHGRRVNLMDGSTLQLAAEPEVVEHYGRPQNQHGAAHWPLLRTVVGFDLWSGAVVGVAEGPYAESEPSLAATVLSEAEPGTLWVGDRNFGLYRLFQVATGRSVDLLTRLNARIAHALARHEHAPLRPGDDLLIEWYPSPETRVEPGLPVVPIAGRLIYVRLERPGFRPCDLYLFTTLTDQTLYPLLELVQLYARRWDVELDLRYVKTTLDMDRLTGKSVDLVRKELWAGLLAYNLIRGLMGRAAQRANVAPGVLSFARCWRRIVDTLRTLSPHLTRKAVAVILNRLLQRLAACRLPKRPKFRIEPRAVWGQPQPYPRIKGSRTEARQAALAKMKS